MQYSYYVSLIPFNENYAEECEIWHRHSLYVGGAPKAKKKQLWLNLDHWTATS